MVLDELSDYADGECTVFSGKGYIYTDSFYEIEDCVILDLSDESESDKGAAVPHTVHGTYTQSWPP